MDIGPGPRPGLGVQVAMEKVSTWERRFKKRLLIPQQCSEHDVSSFER